jgi:hypothetical protein
VKSGALEDEISGIPVEAYAVNVLERRVSSEHALLMRRRTLVAELVWRAIDRVRAFRVGGPRLQLPWVSDVLVRNVVEQHVFLHLSSLFAFSLHMHAQWCSQTKQALGILISDLVPIGFGDVAGLEPIRCFGHVFVGVVDGEQDSVGAHGVHRAVQRCGAVVT